MDITLKAPDGRSVLTIAKAEETIETWKNQIASSPLGSKIVAIDLSGHAYEPEVAQLVADFLTDKVKDVKTLLLDDIIASLPTAKGLKTYDIFTRVFVNAPFIYLDISDNAVGIQGWKVLHPLLRVETLRALVLNNDGLDEVCLKFLAEDILTTEVCEKLEEIRFYNNMAGEGGAIHAGKILRRLVNLKRFTYRGMRPGEAGCAAIAEGLASQVESHGSTKLTELRLEGTYGRDKDGTFGNLFKVLQASPDLTQISLYDTDMGSGACQAVCDRGLSNTSLVVLEIAQNELTQWTVQKAILPLVKKNVGTLKVLDLSANELYSSGVTEVMKAFTIDTDPAIEELKLDETNLGINGVAAIASAHLPNLKKISLKDNGLTAEALAPLSDIFGDRLELEEEDDVLEEDHDEDDKGFEEEEDEDENPDKYYDDNEEQPSADGSGGVDELTKQMSQLQTS